MSNNDLISRQWCLNEYDKRHVGAPGGARKIMEEAPAVDVPDTNVGEWTPVKKALPKKNMPVWVTTEWGEVTDGERWSDCKWFIGCGERNACNNDILAWMPYYSPKPYKGEKP